jgi:hypothetical protein
MMNKARHTQFELARAEGDPGSHLLNGTIECEFNGTGIPDSTQPGPCCTLSTQASLQHEFGGWVFEDSWEVG